MVRTMATSLASLSRSRTKLWSIFRRARGEALEVAEGRVTGAEIVQGKAHAALTQHLHALDHRLDILGQLAFGQFQFQACGVGAAVGQGAQHIVDKLRAVQLAGAVHRQGQLGALRVLAPGRQRTNPQCQRRVILLKKVGRGKVAILGMVVNLLFKKLLSAFEQFIQQNLSE